MAIKTKHQTVVKYNCKDKNDESFENQFFDIPKVINSDISFQLMFGHVPNYYDDKTRIFQHQMNSLIIEKNEQLVFNS